MKVFRIKEMFDDKNDVCHLFSCQRTIATSDGHVSVLNIVVYFFVYVFGLVYEIRENKKLIVIRQLN